MFKEYDVILSKCDLSTAVKCGTKGAIMLVLHKDPNTYEVEFIDEYGDTLELLTVDEDDIELVKE